LLSLALAFRLTPLAIEGALRFGVLDRPDGALKTQAEPVPYLGGIAVYLSFLVTLSVVFELNAAMLGLLLGGTMMAMLGLFDDLRVLTPGLKLAGQLLAAWVMLRSGIYIRLVVIPTWIAIPLSVLWLIGVTNALNILDVSDGLASGVAAIAATGLFVVAVLNGNYVISVATLALVGSLTGFLHFNRPPARIYLGDAGSLFIGFMLAALSMVGAYTARNDLGAVAPVCLLCVPLLDTVLVTLSRLQRGQSPLRGSPDHFAIRLRRRGWSARQVALASYALGALGCSVGVGVVLVRTPWVAALMLAGHACLLGGVLAWLWRLDQPAQPAPHRRCELSSVDSVSRPVP
jgi:UDP-GlcNAc:undecaprenyl-phosphate GlcNAc-1-phosphate transferase